MHKVDKEVNYIPINDMIVIEPVENVSAGGIILNGISENKGIIKKIPQDLEVSYKVGDTVIFNKHAKIEAGIEKLILVKKDQIYLIL